MAQGHGEGAGNTEEALPLLSHKPSLLPDTHRVSPFHCPRCHEGVFADIQINADSVVAVRALPYPLPRQRYATEPGHPLQFFPQAVLTHARCILHSAGLDREPVETDALADSVVASTANFINRNRTLTLQLLDLVERNGLDLGDVDHELVAQLRRSQTLDTGTNAGSPTSAEEDAAGEARFRQELEHEFLVPPDVWQHVEGHRIDGLLDDVIFIVYGSISQPDSQDPVALVEVTEDRRRSAYMSQFTDQQRQEWKRSAGVLALEIGVWQAVTS